MRKILLLTVLTAGLAVGFAEDAWAYMMIGAGGASCGTWTKDRGSPQAHSLAAIDVSWVTGFLSGIGYVGGAESDDPLQGMDAEGVAGWIDNYCRAHPIEHIKDAAAAFFAAHPR
jgi:hypothetical protein